MIEKVFFNLHGSNCLPRPWTVGFIWTVGFSASQRKSWATQSCFSEHGEGEHHLESKLWLAVHLHQMLWFLILSAMTPHSNTLAWRIPWTEEPGRLQSMGSLRVRHDWATSLSLFTFMHWRRKWQPTPVFLPGESQGRGSLVGCRLWGCTESDTTEAT